MTYNSPHTTAIKSLIFRFVDDAGRAALDFRNAAEEMYCTESACISCSIPTWFITVRFSGASTYDAMIARDALYIDLAAEYGGKLCD